MCECTMRGNIVLARVVVVVAARAVAPAGAVVVGYAMCASLAPACVP